MWFLCSIQITPTYIVHPCMICDIILGYEGSWVFPDQNMSQMIQMIKRMFMCHHTDSLAITFGLLNKPLKYILGCPASCKCMLATIPQPQVNLQNCQKPNSFERCKLVTLFQFLHKDNVLAVIIGNIKVNQSVDKGLFCNKMHVV